MDVSHHSDSPVTATIAPLTTTRDGYQATVAVATDDLSLLAGAWRAADQLAPAGGLRVEHRPNGFGPAESGVVIVDLRMPGVTLAACPTSCAPIAIGADPQSAYNAIEAGACDYLVAPVAEERFRRALERACRLTHSLHHQAAANRPRFRSHLFVRVEGQVEPLAVDDIVWLEAKRPYVLVHLIDRTVPVRASMTRVESHLDPDRFLRVHRSTIVRVDRIAQMTRRERGDYDLRLADGATVRLARRRAGRLISVVG